MEKKTRQKAKKKLSKSKDETTEAESENVFISANYNLEEDVKLFVQEKGEIGEDVKRPTVTEVEERPLKMQKMNTGQIFR